MDIIGKAEIESLLRIEEWPAISWYMPVSRIGDPQDSLRYKNCIAQVETRLVDLGMRTTAARDLLQAEYDLAKDTGFWKHLGADGLAVFRSPEALVRSPLPMAVSEVTQIGRRFHLRPLVPLLADRRCLVLGLSRNRLRLFRGDRHRFREIDLPAGTPASLDEALQYERERSLQFHSKTTSAGIAGGKRAAMFHGHGAGVDDQEDNLERYYQLVDRCLFPLLEDPECPMILAGTEEQHAIYRRISRGRTVLPRGIAGNVAEFSLDALRVRAWEIAGEYFAREEGEAVADYLDNLGGSKVAAGLAAVLTAACDGRVDTLFVAEEERVFGLFDPERREVVVKGPEAAGASELRELVDEAMYWTLQQKGRVYVRRRPEMPGDTAICARLRY